MNPSVQDLPYRTIGDETLLGRLYRPTTAAQALVIEVHGGAWVLNDRLANVLIHEHLAARGIAVFAIDFRLAPTHRYPRAVQDINFAVRWAKAHLAELGLAPRRIGLLGTSSGGHLATLAGLRPDDPVFSEADPGLSGQDAHVDFIAACWPILDPLARYHMAQARGMQNLVDNHHAFWPDETAMAEGNPYRNLEAGQITQRPPMLLIQGTEDQNVEHQRTAAFAQSYRSHGGSVEYHAFDGEPHAFVAARAGTAASLRALDLMSDFVIAQSAR